MGYTTNFNGQFDLNKQLSLDDFNELKLLGEDYEIDRSNGKPDTYCQWVPTEDGRGIEWNQGEKFYKYTEWLQWVIDKILLPRGYVLSGAISYQGEEVGDAGVLAIKDNVVVVKKYGDDSDERFCFAQDECSHWYMIPINKKDRFLELAEDQYAQEELETEFSDYLTGGSISYSFTDPKEIK